MEIFKRREGNAYNNGLFFTFIAAIYGYRLVIAIKRFIGQASDTRRLATDYIIDEYSVRSDSVDSINSDIKLYFGAL